jgi:hypothetical protein
LLINVLRFFIFKGGSATILSEKLINLNNSNDYYH